ncbi:GntR family transcriptional regulator [Sciscionella marina]|uniref:GntR family transcriptional regulator n=1 Tax=Sciscionella marina TaxID=508770 RepID=UPI00036C28FE|nr:GntR family transcriptional regulator [Sciscionella marina]
MTTPEWSAASLRLDQDSPIPLYAQLATQLREAIDGGALAPGARLDNETELAARLGISRPTIRQAIQSLVDAGLLVRKRGVGTQVVHNKVARQLRLSSLFDDLTRLGKHPGTRVLTNGAETASEHAIGALEAPELESVHRIERVRLVDEEPIALMNNYLPPGLITPSDAELRAKGLYELLRSAGIRLHAAHQNIGARNATEEDAELLGEPVGAALLTMHRTTYDENGRVVEYGWHVYRASRYSFDLTLPGAR